MIGAAPEDGGPDGGPDRDLLAAEYALGALSPAEAQAVEDAARHDPALAASVASWLRRLAPLGTLIPPVPPPPELWTRLALAAGAGVPVAPPAPDLARRGLRLWRAAALALVASLALVLAKPGPPLPPPSAHVAALLPAGAPAPVFLVQADTAGGARVVALQPPEVAPGRGLELWALPPGATRPVSLGVVPAGGGPVGRIPAQAGTQLLVSLEPAGGSPTGQPTGPVLYVGVLAPAS